MDSLNAIKQAKKALELHRYLFNQYNDSIYLAALAKFQIEHGLIPDMLIGNKTAEALSLSPYRYYKQIVANLERWRWKNDWGSKYLYVNIPGFSMQLYNNKIIEREHKIIVGKVDNNDEIMPKEKKSFFNRDEEDGGDSSKMSCLGSGFYPLHPLYPCNNLFVFLTAFSIYMWLKSKAYLTGMNGMVKSSPSL